MMIDGMRRIFTRQRLSFGFAAVKDLAQGMCEHIGKTLPVKVMANNCGQLSASRIARTLEQCYAMALEAHMRRKLGYFGRVMLASDLRWSLQEMGYPKDFVSLAVEGLIVELSKQAQHGA